MARTVMVLPIYDPQGVLEAAFGEEPVAEGQSAEEVLFAWILSLDEGAPPEAAARAVLNARAGAPPGGGFAQADRLLALLDEVGRGVLPEPKRRGGASARAGRRS